MRSCPSCKKALKDFDYYFCHSCQSVLPTGYYKLPKATLLNLKLTFSDNAPRKVLFLSFPQENSFTAYFLIISLLIILSVVVYFLLFI